MTTIILEAQTHPGNVREHNEDAFYSSVENQLALIADGMGGHAAGEVASDIAIRTFEEIKPEADQLSDTALESHHRIVAHSEAHVESRGMGSALVAAKFDTKEVSVCWVGDSRAYLYSPEEGLKPITEDHSYVQWLLANGQINKHQARIHPDRNLVTQCLGVNPPEPEVNNVPWKRNDIVLLCSDGLTDELDDQTIEEFFKQDLPLKATLNKLMAAALESGGKDNITIVLARNEATTLQVTPVEVGSIKTVKWLPILSAVGVIGGIAALLLLLQYFSS